MTQRPYGGDRRVIRVADATIEDEGDRLVLAPLGAMPFLFELQNVTGDMTTPGVSIGYWDRDRQMWLAGVMTRPQAQALAAFLQRA